jgi:hypothetical protein
MGGLDLIRSGGTFLPTAAASSSRLCTPYPSLPSPATSPEWVCRDKTGSRDGYDGLPEQLGQDGQP